MMKPVISALGFLIFFYSPASQAKDQSMAEVVAHFVKKGQLTAAQGEVLKSNDFLSAKCTGTGLDTCRPIIDFARDCGLPTDVSGIAQLGRRIEQYPVALKAYGQWNESTDRRVAELKQAYDSAVVIANKDVSTDRRVEEESPIMERAEKISQDLASSAGFVYEGGCGAGDDDSQLVSFSLAEKPKSAFYIVQMAFDECKEILSDPYNTSKCEGWTPIPRQDYLSGNYRYRVTWSDGSVSEHAFSVLSKKQKTIEISR